MFQVKVGLASCGIAAGADEIYTLFKEIIPEDNSVSLLETGCLGLCYAEPLVEVIQDGNHYLYGHVTPDIAKVIIQSHNEQKKPASEHLLHKENEKMQAMPVLTKQTRLVLSHAGDIDPSSIDDYIKNGGYKALQIALSKTPEEVEGMVLESGLRGRGGAGFPVGKKWQLARINQAEKRYLICNADEGDPGAFMDRSVLEGDPHKVIEGLIIGGYAMGANEGYIYCRAEYPLAIKRLTKALADARDYGFLGENIKGSDFSFTIHIKEGAGAFVCGEETALIASIEGKRGMPRKRPPYPAVKGLWGYPTSINNVESLANVPFIIREGADTFTKYGTETSRGTKVFALAGKIKNPGLIEVEMGTTIREIIFEIGGGIKNDLAFKAVQMGGPSGGCLPESLIDTPVDYDSLSKTGAIMGSGGMIVLDETTCMVDVARYFLSFTQAESCGKCTFCRVGTKRMLEILEKISRGEGEIKDLERLEILGAQIKETSLCGLGQTAPNPVLTMLRYFRDEYTEHIEKKHCRAGVCAALISYTISEEQCIGCGACLRACPVDAINGEKKKLHTIDEALCTKCGACYRVCKFDAVIKK